MDLISVIVPVYNVENYLDRCVESIVQQTYKHLEIILVDDGSTDRSSEICDEWALKDERIQVIYKENSGLSDARNAGIHIATGEYIGFVDSDDWIAKEMYKNLLNAIVRDSSDIAACGVEKFWENSDRVEMLTHQKDCILNRDEAQLALLEESMLLQPVWYKLYKKSIVEGVSFEKGKCNEDIFWSYQVIGNANKVSILEEVGYHYLQRQDSIMGNQYSLKRLDAVEAVCKRQEYFKEKFPNLEQKGLCNLWFTCMYHGQQALLYLSKEEQKKAFSYLNSVKVKYPMAYRDYSTLKLTHQMWIMLEHISLIRACKIRNFINIGY